MARVGVTPGAAAINVACAGAVVLAILGVGDGVAADSCSFAMRNSLACKICARVLASPGAKDTAIATAQPITQSSAMAASASNPAGEKMNRSIFSGVIFLFSKTLS